MSDIDTLNFSTIEAAIVAQLKTDVTILANNIKSYAGQIEDALEGKIFKLPAAFVLFNGEDFEVVDGPNHGHASEWVVIAMTESYTGGDSVRTGAVGVYEIIQECQKSLVNSRLGLSIDRIRPVNTRLIVARSTFAAYAFTFRMSYDTTFENW